MFELYSTLLFWAHWANFLLATVYFCIDEYDCVCYSGPPRT